MKWQKLKGQFIRALLSAKGVIKAQIQGSGTLIAGGIPMLCHTNTLMGSVVAALGLSWVFCESEFVQAHWNSLRAKGERRRQIAIALNELETSIRTRQ